jgi:hypothetical protein
MVSAMTTIMNQRRRRSRSRGRDDHRGPSCEIYPPRIAISVSASRGAAGHCELSDRRSAQTNLSHFAGAHHPGRRLAVRLLEQRRVVHLGVAFARPFRRSSPVMTGMSSTAASNARKNGSTVSTTCDASAMSKNIIPPRRPSDTPK